MTDIWAKSWKFSHPNFGQKGICQARVKRQCRTFGAAVRSSSFEIYTLLAVTCYETCLPGSSYTDGPSARSDVQAVDQKLSPDVERLFSSTTFDRIPSPALLADFPSLDPGFNIPKCKVREYLEHRGWYAGAKRRGTINKSIAQFLARNCSRNDAPSRAKSADTRDASDDSSGSCARPDVWAVVRDAQMKYDIAKDEDRLPKRTMAEGHGVLFQYSACVHASNAATRASGQVLLMSACISADLHFFGPIFITTSNWNRNLRSGMG
ncbi:hypothetical protein EV121DRAFT_271773 [Schizophyllum commune]